MAELCSPSTTPHDSKLHILLLHDIFFLFSFILYFSYFIFFSPYLLKLLSFLSPLFLTTLLIFSILTLSILNDSTLESNPDFLLKVIQKLGSNIIKDSHGEMYNFEDFELYKIVFYPTPMFDDHVVNKEIIPIEASDSDSDCVTKFCTHEVSSVTVAVAGERKSERFLELLDKFENMGKEKKVVDEPPQCSKSNKVIEELQKEDIVTGSKAACTSIKVPINDNDCNAVNVGTTNNGGDYSSKVKTNGHLEKINKGNNGGYCTSKVSSNGHLEKINAADNGGEYPSKVISNGHFTKINDADNVGLNLDSSRSFDSSIWNYGSMRKEKEWKRTLACKLFEERHNGGGKDGMDSLWEAYETDLDKKGSKKVITKSKSDTDACAIMNANVKKNDRKKSGINEHYYDFENEDEDEEEEYEYELTNEKMCCLQALKMSSGKMNFGMGKSNFVKISKALKGMGWLHNVSRHGKKR